MGSAGVPLDDKSPCSSSICSTICKTITMVLQMDDEQGLLSDLLHIVAIYKANILTIHQSIPVNNVATLTLSVEVRPDTGNISHMVEEMEENSGVHNVKIIARE